MEAMMKFSLWFLDTMPQILLEPPISAFVGLALLCCTLNVIWRMMHL